MGDPEVRAWSDPKPRSMWRYVVVVAVAVLAGWWTWRSGFGADAWWSIARLLITAGAASLAFLAVNAILGRPFRSD